MVSPSCVSVVRKLSKNRYENWAASRCDVRGKLQNLLMIRNLDFGFTSLEYFVRYSHILSKTCNSSKNRNFGLMSLISAFTKT